VHCARTHLPAAARHDTAHRLCHRADRGCCNGHLIARVALNFVSGRCSNMAPHSRAYRRARKDDEIMNILCLVHCKPRARFMQQDTPAQSATAKGKPENINSFLLQDWWDVLHGLSVHIRVEHTEDWQDFLDGLAIVFPCIHCRESLPTFLAIVRHGKTWREIIEANECPRAVYELHELVTDKIQKYEFLQKIKGLSSRVAQELSARSDLFVDQTLVESCLQRIVDTSRVWAQRRMPFETALVRSIIRDARPFSESQLVHNLLCCAVVTVKERNRGWHLLAKSLPPLLEAIRGPGWKEFASNVRAVLSSACTTEGTLEDPATLFSFLIALMYSSKPEWESNVARMWELYQLAQATDCTGASCL
jgi:hypothetical protein